jgi:hypothetical protein
MRGVIPPLPNTPSWRGAQLKYRDNFTGLRSKPLVLGISQDLELLTVTSANHLKFSSVYLVLMLFLFLTNTINE